MSPPLSNEGFRHLLLTFPAKALKHLYDHYYSSLFAVSIRLTNNPLASQDIVQETFINVWEKRKWLAIQHEKPIQHYLVKVVKNKSITYFKRNLRFSESMRSLNDIFPPTEQSVEITIVQNEVVKELRALIDTFPPRERESLLMHIDQDLSSSEMAKEFGVSRKAINKSLLSAIKRLRRRWQELQEGHSKD